MTLEGYVTALRKHHLARLGRALLGLVTILALAGCQPVPGPRVASAAAAPLPSSTACPTPSVTATSAVTPAPIPTPTRTPIPPPAMVITRDIPYAGLAGVDPKSLSLDVYAAPKAHMQPVVIFVHGGGWTGGDKADIAWKHQLFVGSGFVFVSINYRLMPAGKHPTNVQDVARALAWLHGNIGRYGGDAGRLYLIGHSAGAQLSGLVVTDPRYLTAVGESSALIRGVVLLDSNAYDIPLLMPHLGSGENTYSHAFGATASPLWKDASPASYVTPGRTLPPFLMVAANSDASRYEQADRMATLLRAAGNRAEVVEIPDEDHVTVCDKLGLPGNTASRAILRFIASIENTGA
jgi:arylformamidase